MLQSITAAITALQQQGTVRVVSEPKVRTLNNQPAIMKVGTDTVSWTATTTASTTTNGVTTNGVTTYAPTVQTIGVLLSVTPQISADGLITMDVMPVVNTLAGTSTSPGGVGAANSTQQILNTQQTSTLVRVKDGETAVVGGLIQLSDSETADNVPGLSNVPVAGALFRGKYSNKVRQELVIFVTPHLIEN
jgi:type II secretory pathway component GspD/PulD (secretin)